MSRRYRRKPRRHRGRGLFADLFYALADDFEAFYYLLDKATEPFRKALEKIAILTGKTIEEVAKLVIKGTIVLGDYLSEAEVFRIKESLREAGEHEIADAIERAEEEAVEAEEGEIEDWEREAMERLELEEEIEH